MSSPLQKKETMKVPEPTLRRLPWYLSNVKLLKQQGERFVSSTQIAKEINIDASQIAKEMMPTIVRNGNYLTSLRKISRLFFQSLYCHWES